MTFKYYAPFLLSLPLGALAGTPLNWELRRTNVHGKRSFYIDPDGNGGLKPWPDNNLKWCIEAKDQDSEFNTLMDQAWAKWVTALGGTHRSSATVTNAGLCIDDTNVEYLHITLTSDQRASTTVGFKKAGYNDNHVPNQIMNFDKSNTWGTGNSASNLAHEIGHALGLWHEHQRWMAWHADLISNPPRPTPLLKLNCENLADYQTFKDRGFSMDDLCRSVYFAQGVGFSAGEFLEFPKETTNHQTFDFDWNSIMMYSSTSGAKVVDGKKQPTLVKFDGTTLDSILDPSARDGDAIRMLYPPTS